MDAILHKNVGVNWRKNGDGYIVTATLGQGLPDRGLPIKYFKSFPELTKFLEEIGVAVLPSEEDEVGDTVLAELDVHKYFVQE